MTINYKIYPTENNKNPKIYILIKFKILFLLNHNFNNLNNNKILKFRNKI